MTGIEKEICSGTKRSRSGILSHSMRSSWLTNTSLLVSQIKIVSRNQITIHTIAISTRAERAGRIDNSTSSGGLFSIFEKLLHVYWCRILEYHSDFPVSPHGLRWPFTWEEHPRTTGNWFILCRAACSGHPDASLLEQSLEGRLCLLSVSLDQLIQKFLSCTDTSRIPRIPKRLQTPFFILHNSRHYFFPGLSLKSSL